MKTATQIVVGHFGKLTNPEEVFCWPDDFAGNEWMRDLYSWDSDAPEDE